jgi:prepilin-type N-terminal cleavage/methylation domain-containing protein
MNQRGFTLIELLVSFLIGSIVLLALGGFYVATARFVSQSNSQTALQRQAQVIMTEMARQIQPATSITLGKCNADPNSIGVTNSSGVYCFYWGAGRLYVDRPGGATMDLLAHADVPLTAPSFSAGLGLQQTSVIVQFQLRDNVPNVMQFHNTMQFHTTLFRRN